ncbi:MAG: carboxypeptidase-like regulatory domain-containing protein [Candidatus Acidiferrales bacterium]
MAKLLRQIVPGVACLLLALPAPAADPQQEAYARRALEAVAEQLRKGGLDPQAFRIELVGEPVLLPDHASLHDPPGRPPQPASLSGSVLDPTGAPVYNARLELYRADGSYLHQVHLRRDASFDISPPGPGDYLLRAEAPGFRILEVLWPESAAVHGPLRLHLEVGVSDEPLRQSVAELQPGDRLDLPRAIAVVAVIGPAEQMGAVYRVAFKTDSVDLTFTSALNDNNLPFPLHEWQQVNAELEPLYDVALDIDRGPERFYPFLPHDMHSYAGPGAEGTNWMISHEDAVKLSNQQLRYYAAVWLDLIVHMAWLAFEGGSVDSFVEEFEKEPPDFDSSDVAASMRALVTDRAKEYLREQGALNAKHRAAVEPYLRRLLGEGTVAKETNEEELGGLPPSAVLYPAHGGCLHFARVNGRLTLVALVLAD